MVPFRLVHRRMATQFAPLELDSFHKHHLYVLGHDKVKLEVYRRVAPRVSGGGGQAKSVVCDMARFVKQGWKEDAVREELVEWLAVPTKSDPRWFYVVVGQAMVTEPEQALAAADTLVDIYLRQRRDARIAEEAGASALQRRVSRVVSLYCRHARIRYRDLYDSRTFPKTISVCDPSFSVHLPALPQIRLKLLLTRALLHKELYRALMLPLHSVGRQLADAPGMSQAVRHDLLFLDGLGDYFLAVESLALLYHLRTHGPFLDDCTFRKRTYTLLKVMLSTNTLLLRIAVAYGLHTALDDELVAETLQEYVPLTLRGEPGGRYEEEFVADYFEQYVGALYMEQPQVARAFIGELFEAIVLLIPDSYKVFHRRKPSAYHINYKGWTLDVLGRAL